MSTEDLTVLITSFAHGLRDSLMGFAYFYKLDDEETSAISTAKLAELPKAPVTVLQRRREHEKRSPKRPVDKQKPIRIKKRILQCCVLNGGVCLASLVAFNHVILPVLEMVTGVILGHEESARTVVWLWLSSIASGLFRLLWMMPLFILSRIVSLTWFQDIADAAFSGSSSKNQERRKRESLGYLVADILFSLTIQTLFLCQAHLASFLPIPTLALALSVFHVSLLNAFYAFEYDWYSLGWEVKERLDFIQTRWSYFCGFGLPLALLMELTANFWISGCIFSLLFPLLIISANKASPNRYRAPFHLPVFSVSVGLSNYIFNRGVKLNVRRQPTSSNE